eukprot:738650-Pleurochrysis_carterae.AAC.1
MNTLTRLMQKGKLPNAKRRLVRGSDGGSENVDFTLHGLHATLVHRRIFNEIIWARLPPDHSHEEID